MESGDRFVQPDGMQMQDVWCVPSWDMIQVNSLPLTQVQGMPMMYYVCLY